MPESPLSAYVPQPVARWLRDHPERRLLDIEGSLVLADISGFTSLTERLASRGRVGAEEMSDILNRVFAELLAVAARDGAQLLKWGGDAVLLLVHGADHEVRASRVASSLMTRIGQIGRVGPPRAKVTLSMSIGVHSGVFTLMLVGDPELHRELLVVGPATSQVVRLQAAAQAGEIAVSHSTAQALPRDVVGATLPEGRLLVGCPPEQSVRLEHAQPVECDVSIAVPVRIRRHVVDSSGHSEHRRISVAFVRYSGVDELITGHGGELATDHLDAFVRAVQTLAESHGVTFLESDSDDSGGKILLTAGAPVSYEDDEERLLLTCRDIVMHDTALTVHVGVNHGAVFAGDFGPPNQRTFSVKGDAVNVAARLAAKARNREVLSTPGVVGRSVAAFETTPMAPLVLKGKREPLQAVSVGPRVRDSSAPLVRELIGRDTELALLRTECDLAAGGAGRTVVIDGVPGIGKSQLVAHVITEWSGDRILLSGDSYDTTSPYALARRLLRHALGVAEEASTEEVETALRWAATQHGARMIPWLPLIGSVAGVEMAPTDEVAALADEFRKDKTERVTVEFLGNVLKRPTLIAVDNGHLVDASSADLLTMLAASVHQYPWLLLVARRDAVGGVAVDDGRLISLGPLDDHVVRAWVRRELPTLPLTDVTAIAERSGGNPLFLSGLVQAAELGDAIDSLPESVEALVTAQLDRLPAAQRALVRVTSVLGSSFKLDEVAAVASQVKGVADQTALTSLPIFVRGEAEGTYRFEHQLVRDTAYEGLPRSLRRALHAFVGEWLEERMSSESEAAGRISLHFAAAGRRESTWHYSRIAARSAASSRAYAEAEQLLLRAIDAARGLREIAAHERAEVRIELGEAQRRVGRAEAALGSYRSARALVRDDAGAQAHVLVREASVQRRLGRYAAAWKSARRGLALLHESLDPERVKTRSRLAMICSGVRAHQGRYREALEWAQSAERDAVAAGDSEAGADAAAMIFLSLLMLGIPDRHYGEQALALYEQVDDRLRQSEALNNLALLSWNEGLAEQALGEFERAHVLAQQAGDAFQAAATEANVGDMLMRLGRYAEAVDVLQRVLPELIALGAASYEAVARRSLALALAHGGSPDEAWTHIERARVLQEELDEQDELPETRAALELVADLRHH